MALSLPRVGYRGLSGRAALGAYNREHGGWRNREKRVTVGGLLEFAVAFCNGSDEAGTGALTASLPPAVTDTKLVRDHRAAFTKTREALGLPAARQNAWMLFGAAHREKAAAAGRTVSKAEVSAAWETHKAEGGGQSAFASQSAVDRERYLRAHELWLLRFHSEVQARSGGGAGGGAGLVAGAAPRGVGGGGGGGTAEEEPGEADEENDANEDEEILSLTFAVSTAAHGGRGSGAGA